MNRSTPKLLLLLVLGVTVCTGCSDDDGTGDPQTNAITINPEPNTISAPWQLAGPGGFTDSGTGDETLEDLTAGNYTITWGAVTGWTTPSPASATQALTDDGTITFTGTYVAQAGTITINPEPDSIDAPWEITGPGGFDQSGTGDLVLTGRTIGSYTLTWGAVSGWTTPSPASSSRTLTTGGSLTFAGTYVENGGGGEVVWPLDLDNFWTYSYEFGGDPESVTLTAGLVQQVAGVDVTVVQYSGSDIFENYFIYLRNDTGGLFFYGDELFGGLLTPDLWCKYPCTVGDEWSTSGQGAVVNWEVIATSESVTVPDGTYDCIHVRGLAEGGGTPADHWFAVGVGEVKMTHGAVLMELTSKYIQ